MHPPCVLQNFFLAVDIPAARCYESRLVTAPEQQHLDDDWFGDDAAIKAQVAARKAKAKSYHPSESPHSRAWHRVHTRSLRWRDPCLEACFEHTYRMREVYAVLRWMAQNTGHPYCQITTIEDLISTSEGVVHESADAKFAADMHVDYCLGKLQALGLVSLPYPGFINEHWRYERAEAEGFKVDADPLDPQGLLSRPRMSHLLIVRDMTPLAWDEESRTWFVRDDKQRKLTEDFAAAECHNGLRRVAWWRKTFGPVRALLAPEDIAEMHRTWVESGAWQPVKFGTGKVPGDLYALMLKGAAHRFGEQATGRDWLDAFEQRQLPLWALAPSPVEAKIAFYAYNIHAAEGHAHGLARACAEQVDPSFDALLRAHADADACSAGDAGVTKACDAAFVDQACAEEEQKPCKQGAEGCGMPHAAPSPATEAPHPADSLDLEPPAQPTCSDEPDPELPADLSAFDLPEYDPASLEADMQATDADLFAINPVRVPYTHKLSLRAAFIRAPEHLQKVADTLVGLATRLHANEPVQGWDKFVALLYGYYAREGQFKDHTGRSKGRWVQVLERMKRERDPNLFAVRSWLSASKAVTFDAWAELPEIWATEPETPRWTDEMRASYMHSIAWNQEQLHIARAHFGTTLAARAECLAARPIVSDNPNLDGKMPSLNPYLRHLAREASTEREARQQRAVKRETDKLARLDNPRMWALVTTVRDTTTAPADSLPVLLELERAKTKDKATSKLNALVRKLRANPSVEAWNPRHIKRALSDARSAFKALSLQFELGYARCDATLESWLQKAQRVLEHFTPLMRPCPT